MVPQDGQAPDGSQPVEQAPADGSQNLDFNALMAGGQAGGPTAPVNTQNISQNTIAGALSMLRKGGEANPPSGFTQANAPINLIQSKAQPPTVKGVGGKTTNLRGHNRKIGGKVNTNLNFNGNTSVESSLLNKVNNIQS